MSSKYRLYQSNVKEEPVHILLPEDESSVRIPEVDKPSECSNDEDEHAKNIKRQRLISVAIVAIFIVTFLIVANVTGFYFKTDPASLSVTLPQTFLCPEKTLEITHICELPDLDTGPDSTMDIKVLVDGQHYWPQDRDIDCFKEYGHFEDTCILPDTSLTSCFELANSREWVVDNKALSNIMKITIYESDFFFDDFIDILVSKDQWYNGDDCHAMKYVFNSTSTSASIQMSVTPKQAPNVSGDDSSPTP